MNFWETVGGRDFVQRVTGNLKRIADALEKANERNKYPFTVCCTCSNKDKNNARCARCIHENCTMYSEGGTAND